MATLPGCVIIMRYHQVRKTAISICSTTNV